MLQDLNREVVTWLGYLQRGSVLLILLGAAIKALGFPGGLVQ